MAVDNAMAVDNKNMKRKERLIDCPTLVQGSETWLRTREKMNGTGSRYAAMIGVDSDCSRGRAWRIVQKKEKVEPNWMMWFGNWHEDDVADVYARLVPEVDHLEEYGFKEDESLRGEKPHERHGASIDRIVVNKDGTRRALEIKCRLTGAPRVETPLKHAIQMMGHMSAYGFTSCDYICWNTEDDTYVVERLEWSQKAWDLIAERIRFFDQFVDKPPPRMKRGEKDEVVAYLNKHLVYSSVPLYE